WVAFNRDQAIAVMEDLLSAADRAVWAHGARHLCARVLRAQRSGALAHCLSAGTVAAMQKLADYRPAKRKFLDHRISPGKEMKAAISGARARPSCPSPHRVEVIWGR